MSDRETLFEDPSPHGHVTAIVEHDGATCYLYLFGEPPYQTKACWVRNLRPAPAELDVEAMENGDPPMMPRANCRHPQGARLPMGDNLRVVWTESGDGAALFEGNELLAVIPAWSGQDGFEGYARDCIGETPLCWELGTADTNAQFQAIEEAEDYWNAWDAEPGPWPALQSALTKAYESQLGAKSRYYAIDGGEWPPKAILRVDRPDQIVLATLGVSIRSQPYVDMHFDRPDEHRRIELGLSFAAPIEETSVKRIGRYLSAQTNLPWSNHTYLDEGHTIPADVFEELSHGRFPAVLLLQSPPGVPQLPLPSFRGLPIRLLWMVPITAKERQLAMDSGSDALVARLRKGNVGWTHPFNRPSVA